MIADLAHRRAFDPRRELATLLRYKELGDPCVAMFGYYPEDMQAWWGAPHAGLVDEHEQQPQVDGEPAALHDCPADRRQ